MEIAGECLSLTGKNRVAAGGGTFVSHIKLIVVVAFLVFNLCCASVCSYVCMHACVFGDSQIIVLM